MGANLIKSSVIMRANLTKSSVIMSANKLKILHVTDIILEVGSAANLTACFILRWQQIPPF